jgi:hypothetical protein
MTESDTGYDLWLDSPAVARRWGVSERTARHWAARHACAVAVPRDVGGISHRYWRPALEAALAGDTGLADAERREMLAFAPRLFEP